MRYVIALGALIATAVSFPAAAYELLRVGPTCGNSQNLFWDPAVAHIDYSFLSLGYQQQAEQARLRWNQSVRLFHFDLGNGAFCNGVTSLGFSATDCGGADLGNGTLGLTRLRWDDKTGRLLDADTVFNVNSPLLQNLDIFRQVAMHEMGHVLGLDHSDACDANAGAGTLMRSFLDPGAPRIEAPTADDIAGANFIYAPKGGGAVPSGSNSCSIVPRRASLWSSAALFIVPVLLLLGRLRCAQSREP